MATIHTVSVSALEIGKTLTIKVRFLALFNARITLSTYIFRFAAWVAGCQVEMELAGPEQPADLNK